MRRATLVLLAFLAACSSGPGPASEATIDLLASDAHVIVADTRLVLPMVALSGYLGGKMSYSLNRSADRRAARKRFEAFRQAAADPRTAPQLDHVEISIEAYGWNDADMTQRRICPRLRRQWSRALCDDPWAALDQAMPVNPFYLVDRRKLESVEAVSFSGASRTEQLRSMTLRAGAPSVACDAPALPAKPFCTAAVPVAGDLIAVWTVWDDPDGKEDHRQKAEREAAAILAFVQHALGPREDYPALFKAACGLRHPGSVPGPEGDICPENKKGT